MSIARYIAPKTKARIFIFGYQNTIKAQEISLGEGAGFAFLTPKQLQSWPLAHSVSGFVKNQLEAQNTFG